MDDERERFAVSTGKNPAVVDKLDQILTGPNDRAFLVCTYRECVHNVKGECTIYTVQDVPPMKPGAPCDRYEIGSRHSGADED